MPELALYNEQRDPLAGHLDSLSMPQLVRRETTTYPQQALGRSTATVAWPGRSDAVAGGAVASGQACSLASTSEVPGGSSGVTFAMRTLVLTRR